MNLPKIDIIITSHNYGNFLSEALNSVFIQNQDIIGEVIVVDDASDPEDLAQEICQKSNVKYIRTEFKSPIKARQTAFQLCQSPLVHFLDADNVLNQGYLLEASRCFSENSRLAIVYANFDLFGEMTGQSNFPAIFNQKVLELGNFIDSSSVWRRDAICQIDAMNMSESLLCEDWRLARAIMRSGHWEAILNPITIKYRIHDKQRSKIKRTYFLDADLKNETVTIFTAFSRPELWEKRKEWLENQTWKNIRLVVANTSGQNLSFLDNKFQGVTFYNQDLKCEGETRKAAIYNRMLQEVNSEFIFLLKEDVVVDHDAIEKLMNCFLPSLTAVAANQECIEDCILIRRSHIQDELFCGDITNNCFTKYLTIDENLNYFKLNL